MNATEALIILVHLFFQRLVVTVECPHAAAAGTFFSLFYFFLFFSMSVRTPQQQVLSLSLPLSLSPSLPPALSV